METPIKKQESAVRLELHQKLFLCGLRKDAELYRQILTYGKKMLWRCGYLPLQWFRRGPTSSLERIFQEYSYSRSQYLSRRWSRRRWFLPGIRFVVDCWVRHLCFSKHLHSISCFSWEKENISESELSMLLNSIRRLNVVEMRMNPVTKMTVVKNIADTWV